MQYYSHCDDVKTYKFIVYKNNDFCTDVNLLKVIKFFNSENYGFDIHNLNGKSPFKIFEYQDFKDEYILQIKDKRALRTFQMLLYYAKSIYNDISKQNELIKAIDLPKLEYEDDKKDFLEEFAFIFDDKGFVVEEIEDNKDNYLQKTENLIIQEVKKVDEDSPSVLCLEYKKQELLLNGRLILKCQSCSGNDNILKFLIVNPNQTWIRSELNKRNVLHTVAESNVSEYTKSFYQFLIDIKVSGKRGYNNIGNLFFSIDRSKNSIHLKNPIFEKDLKEHKIDFANEEELLEIMFQKND